MKLQILHHYVLFCLHTQSWTLSFLTSPIYFNQSILILAVPANLLWLSTIKSSYFHTLFNHSLLSLHTSSFPETLFNPTLPRASQPSIPSPLSNRNRPPPRRGPPITYAKKMQQKLMRCAPGIGGIRLARRNKYSGCWKERGKGIER